MDGCIGAVRSLSARPPKGPSETATWRATLSCATAGASSVPNTAIAVSEAAIFMKMPFAKSRERGRRMPSPPAGILVRLTSRLTIVPTPFLLCYRRESIKRRVRRMGRLVKLAPRRRPAVTARSVQAPDLEVGRWLVTQDLVVDRHALQTPFAPRGVRRSSLSPRLQGADIL